MKTILYYIHDPMCSWCWAFRPTWELIKQRVSKQVEIVNVAGGLAPDTDEPMSQALQNTIKGYWQSIHNQLGTDFNFNFWEENTPRRSTFIACRAVIAAKNQEFEEQMIEIIQHGYYLWAMNPSDEKVLLYLAKQCLETQPPINIKQFADDLNSSTTQQELERQIALARVLTSQGFPSLVLLHNGKRTLIEHDYRDPVKVLSKIKSLLLM